MPVTVVTDSTHYLPHKTLTAKNIEQVSLYVTDHDGNWQETEATTFNRFYTNLKNGLPATTSQPSIGDFIPVYERVLEQGNDIISLHISGGISGTVHTAEQAAELVLERYPNRSIAIIDSQTSAGGLGLTVLAASAATEQTDDLQVVKTHVEETLGYLKIWFCLDTLDYLQRGGRIGRTQAWLGSTLQVKPILSIKGEITPVERVRTRGRALEKMVDYMKNLQKAGLDGWAVQHIQAPEQAAELVARGREIFGVEPAIVSEVGPVVGSYTGPGMIGVGGIPKSYLESLAPAASTPGN